MSKLYLFIITQLIHKFKGETMNTQELITLSYELYKNMQYNEAYNILIKNKTFFGKDSFLYNLLFSLASRLNKIDDAIFYLKEAIIKYKMWYPTDSLDNDADLDNIRDLDSYKELYLVNEQRGLDCKYSGDKKIDIFVPKEITSNLFFMLHGNSQFVEIVKETFNSTTINNHIIALPQTREFSSYLNYSWRNSEFGLEVVNEHFQEVISEYNVQEENITLAAFAAGSNILLSGLIENKLKAKKVIFFRPWFPNLAKFDSQMHLLSERNIKIVIACGIDDQHGLPIANNFDKILTKYNVKHKNIYKVTNNLSNGLPTNAKEIIEDSFIYFKEKN